MVRNCLFKKLKKMQREIKVGQILIAKESRLTDDNHLKEGNEYSIIAVTKNMFVIDLEISKNHHYLKEDLGEYFTFKDEIEPHKQYMTIDRVNTPKIIHGSLLDAENEAKRILNGKLTSILECNESVVYVVEVVKKLTARRIIEITEK